MKAFFCLSKRKKKDVGTQNDNSRIIAGFVIVIVMKSKKLL